MKILFITSTRLGDAVLSTGALDHLIKTHPGAEITVACGPLVEGLFRDAPGVRRVIALKKKPLALHWLRLWRETVGTAWDIVVDLRDSLVSRLVRAKRKYVWHGTQDRSRHKVEQIGALLGVSPPPAPALWFSEEARIAAAGLVPSFGGEVLALGPAANWPGKTWDPENFIALAEKLTAPDGILPGARIAVFAAPGEEKIAKHVLYAFPPERRIDVIAKAPPALAAAALARCAFYIGNDSGLMHCAAAAGMPTLGLFGPSWPQLYRPWGPRAAFVSTPENYVELTSYPGYDPDAVTQSLMGSLTVDAAEKAARELWKKVTC